jgi:hypothetical protein
MDASAIGMGLAAIGAAEISKDAIQRILAPTADYVGAGVLTGTKATVNIVRVLASAVRRLGPRLEVEGQVPPRVMREVLDQAPFCDDELTAEYIGGILASSYGTKPRDDRGVALMATIRRLSTYSIRMHYICYREHRRLFPGPLPVKPLYDSLPNTVVAIDLRIFANFSGFRAAMDLSAAEDTHQIYFHGFYALGREDLLNMGSMGDPAFLAESLRAKSGDAYEFDTDGFVYQTTMAGEELFAWGLGQGGMDKANRLNDRDVDLHVELAEVAPGNFVRLAELRQDP